MISQKLGSKKLYTQMRQLALTSENASCNGEGRLQQRKPYRGHCEWLCFPPSFTYRKIKPRLDQIHTGFPWKDTA